MYAGTTLRTKSGRLGGTHQQIDRLARKRLAAIAPNAWFPDSKQILHFEGKNGPDGIKRKSPGVDEPWHFIDPQNPQEGDVLRLITEHKANLAAALTRRDTERAAFEAAWLAHAVTDGLTPAHHVKLDKIVEQLSGKSAASRDSKLKKIIVPGESPIDLLASNWKYWGAKGAMSSHMLFEAGIVTIRPLTRGAGLPSQARIDSLKENGFEYEFLRALANIASLNLYDSFLKRGWTVSLAKAVKTRLLPEIIQTVTLAWYDALTPKENSNGKS